MVQMTQEQLVEIANVYLGANTPFYFFDNLRRTAAVQALARESSAGDLITSANELLAQHPPYPNSILQAFAVLCALSLKPNAVSADYFRNIDLSAFRWGSNFLYYASQYTNNNVRVELTDPTPAPAEVHQDTEVTVRT